MEAIKPVATTNLTEDASSFAFHNSTVIAKNNSCLLSIDFDHPFTNMILPYTKFNELITKIPQDKMIRLYESESKLKIVFNTGKKIKTTASIPCMASQLALITSEELLPPLESETRKVPTNFIEGLKMCSDTLPRESLNFAMTLYSVQDDTVTSSDEARLSRYQMDTGLGMDFLISRDNANIIIASNFDECCAYENSIIFIGSDRIARFALPTEKYPEIKDDIFTGEDPVEVSFTTKQIISALERSILFSEGSSDMAKIATLYIKPIDYKIATSNEFGQNVEIGKAKANLAEPIFMKINPVYLLQILKLVGKNSSIKAVICKHRSGFKVIFHAPNFKFVLASWNM